MYDVNDIIAENIGLINKQLGKFKLTSDPDAESLAYEALYNAICSYDESNNTKLATYATVCIYNALCTYIRTQRKKRQLEIISYNAIVYSDESTTCEFIDLIPAGSSVEETYIQSQGVLTIHRLFDEVLESFRSERHKQIIRCWRESDFTMTTAMIAKEVGTSQSYVSQTLVSFRNKLKRRLKEESNA